MAAAAMTPRPTAHTPCVRGVARATLNVALTLDCAPTIGATLLRRTFDVDIKRCTGCAGRMTVGAVVTDAASMARLLGALRRSRDPPVAA